MLSEKISYRIMLLLIAGSAAFSSAMNELNRVQDFTLQTSSLVAELTGHAPAREVREVPDVPDVPEIPDVDIPDVDVPAMPDLPELPAVSEKRVITVVHFQKRDGKQCSISSSLQ